MLVALVNLREDAAPDFYIYTRAELAQRVTKVYDAYMAKPKRDGTDRKDVSFRWFDEVSFDDSDRTRKNNWDLIEKALRE